MSGLGLEREGSLPVIDARRVRLHNARRGFGKLSQYGDRYAMVLEPLQPGEPIRAELIGSAARDRVLPEAIALTVTAPQFARLAQREGYRADALLQHVGDGNVAAALWDLSARHRHDLASYRRALRDAISYASGHYIPHPLLLGDAPALTFLAPGVEGSGDVAVVPIRVASGMTGSLSLAEAWQRKPNESQLEYFVMCLLAEEHGVSLADVDDRDADPDLRERLHQQLERERPGERGRFRRALQLSDAAYASAFSEEA